jgi:hypothetical protein
MKGISFIGRSLNAFRRDSMSCLAFSSFHREGGLLLRRDLSNTCLPPAPTYPTTVPLASPSVEKLYKAIFKVGDSRIGQWSDEVSLTVGG